MEYTKGEWKAESQQNLVSGKFEYVIKIPINDVSNRIIATTPYTSKYNNHEANANLISAAPNMYETLKEANELIKIARQYFPKSIHNNAKFQLENTCATVNKALDKAEGKV